jgi:hypothetical protein
VGTLYPAGDDPKRPFQGDDGQRQPHLSAYLQLASARVKSVGTRMGPHERAWRHWVALARALLRLLALACV